MSVTSDWPKDLHGKITTPKFAEVDIGIRFDLWENYTHWMDRSKQSTHWYEDDVLAAADVTIEIALGTEIIFKKILKEFGPISVHHVFEDTDEGCCDLKITISNLNQLPIRDDTGIFVCGMFDIETIKLQDVEIKGLLESTLFGKNIMVTLPISKPIYSWMIDNWPSILPGKLNKIIDANDLRRYNKDQLFLGVK